MRILRSTDVEPAEALPGLDALMGTITKSQLEELVRMTAVPRHAWAEPGRNRATADWIHGFFSSLGYRVHRHGKPPSVIALPPGIGQDVVLASAHFDSAPDSPGADDNASGVAALLTCAAACARADGSLPVAFAAFNQEEQNLAGSRAFVSSYLPVAGFSVACAHVLEAVGFTRGEAGSQRLPSGFPIRIDDRGDFLGLLANEASAVALSSVLSRARTDVPDLPVTGFIVDGAGEEQVPILGRSDNEPFWRRGIPGVLWTDTAELRNPHYHKPSDTPETLDYDFLERVAKLFTASVVDAALRAARR